MKKILVVLLILAVAGGVFAQQGEWSIGGKVEIGARINFDPQPDVDQDDPATVNGIGFNEYDPVQGGLNLTYMKEGLSVGLSYKTFGDSSIDAAFNGENFKGQVAVDHPLKFFSMGTGFNAGADRGDISRLWGEYKFLNGVVTLVGAFASADTQYWVSDLTGSYKADPLYNGELYGSFRGWESFGANPFFHGNSFTKVDHHNYLLAAVDLSALNFGVMIPGLFPYSGNWGYGHGEKTSTQVVKDSVRQTVLGLSVNHSPFEVAAQFYIENYGIYFGGKFFAGPITVGLSFMGELDGDGQPYSVNGVETLADADPKRIKIGGGVEYSGPGFGAGVKGFYDMNEGVGSGDQVGGYYTTWADSWLNGGISYLTTIGVEPSFFYDAIPSHLRFTLGAGMYFLNYTDGDVSSRGAVWALQPEVQWNFLGTGTGGYYYPLDTAIFARYRLVGADGRDTWGPDAIGSVNFFDIIFKWSF
jgi:hypothetical protein